jgi:hypothetical protein
MNKSTTPRLWAAKRSVLEIMDDYNTLFILGAFPTVWMILTAPVGMGGAPPRASRTTTPRVPSRGGGGATDPAPGGGSVKEPVAEPPVAEPAPAPRGNRGGGSTPSVPKTGRAGSRESSAKALGQREATGPRPVELTAEQQAIRAKLIKEHESTGPLHPTVASDAVKGAAGKGAGGADVPLLNGGGREVSVHSGEFTAKGVGSHLVDKAGQAGVTEIYLQVNSPGASREGLIRMIPQIRQAFVDLNGKSIRFYGSDGKVWWEGFFRGPAQ